MSIVTVTAPSRLHFGMFAFGQPDARNFGGVGTMIDKPGLRLRVTSAARWEVIGPLANRVQQFAERVLAQLDIQQEPTCRIEVLSAPPEHVGLGVGTQLGLSVAAGLCAFLDRGRLSACQLAELAQRGERSAIGTYGFKQGGLLVEAGKLAGDTISPLVARVPLPAQWRFVAMLPVAEQGLSGSDERRAFSELPPVPPETTAELCREALLGLVPAAAQARFDDFAQSLYRFGYTAGKCFAKFQHGAFASDQVARLVAEVQSHGVTGVGQSSWGPTLFAVVPSDAAADELIAVLQLTAAAKDRQFVVAAPNNDGARIEQE